MNDRPSANGEKQQRKTVGGLITPRTGGTRQPVRDQINNNLVALISLVLAIASLSYNTWRNEKTEIQRNWRQASFQILVEVGELNQIILMRRYFPKAAADSEKQPGEVRAPQSWVAGWGKATMIRDLTSVMPEPMPEAGRRLFNTWQEHAGDLDDTDDEQAREEASRELLEAVEHLRSTTVGLIGDLS